MSTLELKAKKADLFEAIMSVNDENVINRLWISIVDILEEANIPVKQKEISRQKVLNGLEQFKNVQYVRRTATETRKMLEPRVTL